MSDTHNKVGSQAGQKPRVINVSVDNSQHAQTLGEDDSFFKKQLDDALDIIRDHVAAMPEKLTLHRHETIHLHPERSAELEGNPDLAFPTLDGFVAHSMAGKAPAALCLPSPRVRHRGGSSASLPTIATPYGCCTISAYTRPPYSERSNEFSPVFADNLDFFCFYRKYRAAGLILAGSFF